MKNPRFHRLVVGLCALLVLLVGVATRAQGQNLLTNPGFESPFVNQGGSPTRMVAQGWTAWHIPAASGAPSYQNQQPEYGVAASDMSRIHGGSNAQLLSSFFATHTGGVYQKVTGITSGSTLTFSVWAYVWSSAFDDPSVSEQDGGVIVQVGIDPTGGSDATSAKVVWSAAASKYDAYNQYSVSAKASSSSVTVYIRSTISAPAKNNDIYLDDAALMVSSGVPTATKVEDGGIVDKTSTPTATPTTASVPVEASPTQEEPTITLTPSPTAPTATYTPSPTVDMSIYKSTITYKVVKGDTLQAIAKLYGSSIDAIASINGLADSNVLSIGQELLIPVKVPPLASATPTDTPVGQPAANPVSGGSTTTYVVQLGDTLSTIAARFGVTTTALAQLNGIVNPNLVYLGATLRIPTSGGTTTQPTAVPGITPVPSQPTTYTVQAGDNLYQISLRTGVSLATIINLNGITDPNLIYVGETLKLS